MGTKENIAYLTKNYPKLVFCRCCAQPFQTLEDMSKHIEIKAECKTRENISYLIRNYPEYCSFPELSKSVIKEEIMDTVDELEDEEREKIISTFSKNNKKFHVSYKCPTCGDLFDTRPAITHHIAEVHKFPIKANVYKQKLGPQLFRQVTKIFKRDKLLISFDDEKTGYTLHQCTICGVKYSAESSVITHIKKKHKGLEYAETKLKEEVEEK